MFRSIFSFKARELANSTVQTHTKVPRVWSYFHDVCEGWVGACVQCGRPQVRTFLDCSPACLFTEAGTHVEPRTH